MAEYINKEELIKACDYAVCYEDDEETFGISEARIDLMPTIDIVRCKECKNYSENIIWETESRPQYFCIKNDHYCKDDWYCAGGGRRQKGGKK
jgi:hypothetical protein